MQSQYRTLHDTASRGKNCQFNSKEVNTISGGSVTATDVANIPGTVIS